MATDKRFQSAIYNMNAAAEAASTRKNADQVVDNILRPTRLEDYLGQSDAVESIRIAVHAAKRRKEPLEHVLLYGAPGLGKTTLAYLCASAMGAPIVLTSGPALEKPSDLVGILTNLGEGHILFIDEIHRLSAAVEEFLYSAMEDFVASYVDGTGACSISKTVRLNRFTLIGATTRAGSLSAPFRNRFGILARLEYYTFDELTRIVERSAKQLGFAIDPVSALAIAKVSRGTPRIANRLLKRVRDYAEVLASGQISIAVVRAVMKREKIDGRGLDENDRGYLQALVHVYKGGPVGVAALAATMNEDKENLEGMIEPFLLRLGLINRTKRGRIAEPEAYKVLGAEVGQ